MCLAIPGKIVDLLVEDRSLAVVDVLGVRRRQPLCDLGERVALLLRSGDEVGHGVLRYGPGVPAFENRSPYLAIPTDLPKLHQSP